ncbi:MAG: ORF6N domain-containing protein [Ignavibacteriales bacterium]|nr:ORF6N domain-containing protein [Ignavibacteriales bacterium]
MKALVPIEIIGQRIILLRGENVLIDRDLAELYDVETKYLNRQVKRNIKRFPSEFMFRLTRKEKKEVVTNWHHLEDLKFSHQLPFAFTELGVAMLSSVLNSERAIQVNIQIMKTFVQLRKMYSSNKDLARRLDEIEKKYDGQFKLVFDALRKLLAPPPAPKREPMGFLVKEKTVLYNSKKK